MSKNTANKKKILIGTVLSFNENPFHHGLKDSVSISENTAILINVNKIEKIGSPNELVAETQGAEVYDFQDNLLMSGFIDAHAHYPQTPIIASWGKRLIDWLNTCLLYTSPSPRDS